MNVTLNQTITRPLAITALLLALLGLAVVFASPAGAAPVDVLTQCDNGSQVCAGTNKNSLFGVIRNVINLLLTIIGIIAVIMIIIGGYRYTTSAGDPGQTKSARDTIIYALVGVVLAIMAYGLVNFVLSRL